MPSHAGVIQVTLDDGTHTEGAHMPNIADVVLGTLKVREDGESADETLYLISASGNSIRVVDSDKHETTRAILISDIVLSENDNIKTFRLLHDTPNIYTFKSLDVFVTSEQYPWS